MDILFFLSLQIGQVKLRRKIDDFGGMVCVVQSTATARLGKLSLYIYFSFWSRSASICQVGFAMSQTSMHYSTLLILFNSPHRIPTRPPTRGYFLFFLLAAALCTPAVRIMPEKGVREGIVNESRVPSTIVLGSHKGHRWIFIGWNAFHSRHARAPPFCYHRSRFFSLPLSVVPLVDFCLILHIKG